MTKKHPVKEEEEEEGIKKEEEGIKKEGEENQPQNPAGNVITAGCPADSMKEEPESPLKQEQPGQTMPPRTSLEEVSTTLQSLMDATQSAKVLMAFSRDKVHQDESNDTQQPMCEFQISSLF